MALSEEHVVLRGSDSSLSAILHLPDRDKPRGAIAMIHGWTGCKLGPHRMFVKMARRLAEQGWASLRLDLRGRGDSQGDESKADLLGMVQDAKLAAGDLRGRFPDSKIVLLGICSGANVAVGVLAKAPQPDGLILWSMPTYGSQAEWQQGLLQTRSVLQKYWHKALNFETWKKAIRGRLQPRMIIKAIFSPLKDKTGRGGRVDKQSESELDRVCLTQLSVYIGPILYAYGTADPMAGPGKKAFQEIASARKGPTEFIDVPGANHSFYDLAEEAKVLDESLAWLNRVFPGMPSEESKKV